MSASIQVCSHICVLEEFQNRDLLTGLISSRRVRLDQKEYHHLARSLEPTHYTHIQHTHAMTNIQVMEKMVGFKVGKLAQNNNKVCVHKM